MSNQQSISRKHVLSYDLQFIAKHFGEEAYNGAYIEQFKDILIDLARLLANHDIATLEELEETIITAEELRS